MKTEEEILNWVRLNMPFAIMPSKTAKTKYIKPFTSHHAFDVVCEHFANKIYNELQNSKKDNENRR